MERDIIIVNAAKLLAMMLLLEIVALLYIETKKYAMPEMTNFIIFFRIACFCNFMQQIFSLSDVSSCLH